jgi:hypothetical protein
MSVIKSESPSLSVGEIRSRLREVGLTVDAPISAELSSSLVMSFRFIASELGLPISSDFSNIIEDDDQKK